MAMTPPGYVGDTTKSPIMACAVGAIVTSFLAIGVLSSYLPRRPPMAIPYGLLIASGVLALAGVLQLSRKRDFAWKVFFSVARWVLMLTGVFAVMAEFVFIKDQTRGAPLAILTIVLALAAINVPVVLGFSVARHERIDPD
jgi:hypothetical protein